jgi:hypothetical protein
MLVPMFQTFVFFALMSQPAPQPEVSILLKNRSVEGLEQVHTKHGAIKVDLEGRFRHAMVLRVRPDGSLALECVDSAEHAAKLAGVPTPKE